MRELGLCSELPQSHTGQALTSKGRTVLMGAGIPTALGGRCRGWLAGALLYPHHLLLLVCSGRADAAKQGVEVTPAVGGQTAVETGHSVQLALFLPARVQGLLLRGAEPLQGLPAQAREEDRLRVRSTGCPAEPRTPATGPEL